MQESLCVLHKSGQFKCHHKHYYVFKDELSLPLPESAVNVESRLQTMKFILVEMKGVKRRKSFRLAVQKLLLRIFF